MLKENQNPELSAVKEHSEVMPDIVRRGLIKKISIASVAVPAAIVLTDANTNIAFASA